MPIRPVLDHWVSHSLSRTKKPLWSSYFFPPCGRKHIIGASESDGDHSSISQNGLSPHSPTAKPWSQHPPQEMGGLPQTCTPCRGAQTGFPSALFCGSQERDSRCAHPEAEQTFQPGRALWGRNLASLSRCFIHLSCREDTWLYQLAKSVLSERDRHFAEGWGRKEKKMLLGRDEWGRQAPVPGFQGKTPHFFLRGVICLQ